MIVTSRDIQPGGTIPRHYTCDGEDQSPNLAWSEIPSGTQSFVLIVHDPDAPAKDWLHWLVINIPKDIQQIETGSVPAGAQQLPNDFGRVTWGGPCPPRGVHRYFFEVYALDVPQLNAGNLTEVKQQLVQHGLAAATLMATYTRTQQR